MATEIINPLFDCVEYFLTSATPDVTARTDKDRIRVSLLCENGRGGNIEEFYSATLYAYNGLVEITDIGSIIEEYFRARDKVMDMIDITVDDISVSARFLYCEYAVTDDFELGDTMLVAAKAQRVHQDSAVVFAASDRGSDTPFTIRAVGRRADNGRLDVVSRTEHRTLSAEYSVHFYVSRIIQWALGRISAGGGVEVPLADVRCISIEYAGLQKLCYIVPAPAYLTFGFRNIFNVREFVDVVGTVTTKTEVGGNVAVCGGRSVRYDRNLNRTFTVETEPIPSDEVPLFEQFLASHSVCIPLCGEDYPVIITGQTCEPSSDDSSLSTFKFTWQFAGRRPVIFDSLVSGIMPARSEVFTDSFSPEYA